MSSHKKPLRLIVGLGNPGEKYQDTRHNAGVWLLDEIAASHAISLKLKKDFNALYGKLDHPHGVHLAFPQTFMNASGDAVQKISHYYDIAPEEILVLQDELDFPVGKIQLKFGGSTGGHNGLNDIAEKLNSKNFWRLRIGIGRPLYKDQVIHYVLKAPSTTEKDQLMTLIHHVVGTFSELLNGHFEKVQQHLHTQSTN